MAIFEDGSSPFKRQLNKMIKHTQEIRRQQPTSFLSVFDHFVGLALNGLIDAFGNCNLLSDESKQTKMFDFKELCNNVFHLSDCYNSLYHSFHYRL